MLLHKRKSGLPPYLHAAYLGYTGRKNACFPIRPGGEPARFPDVTGTLERFRDEILEEVRPLHERGLKGRIEAMRLMAKNFPTAEPWDIKFHPDFPGRDEQGRVQYARYKGKVVSANYLSNNIYGQVLAALGYPLWFARLAGQMDACGVAEILFKRNIPPRELRRFRDTPEDQRAIISGYDDYRHNQPWKNPAVDPAEPYPDVVELRQRARELLDVEA